ncbi:TPA: matrixin family metalloprotease [Candidatus Ventrenecus stercoripullorum]|nr:matrixin family metalloprotease [Candidatus Ventrenecus stercoripullorum]
MKKIRTFFVSGIILLLLTIVPIQAHATTYYTYNNHVITWNVENIWYYVDSSVSSYYTYLILRGTDNWVHTGVGYNRLYPLTRTTNISLSAVDFYSYGLQPNTLAITTVYKRVNGQAVAVNPNNENWLFAEIAFDENQMNTYEERLRLVGVVHELGHAWGLAHNPDTHSVMYWNASDMDSSVTGVTSIDNATFNYLYP